MQHEMIATAPITEGAADALLGRLKTRLVVGMRAVGTGGAWHSAGHVEAVLGVALVSVAGAVVPGQWGFLTLHPHPLWIVVLAIAIRYGAPSGTVAGLLAAISQCAALWLRPDARFQPIPAHAMIEPFLFIVVGTLIGHAVRAQRQRLTEAEATRNQATDALHALAQEHATTHAVKVELEKQIIGQPDSVMTLYEVAKGLETLHRDDLYPAMLGLIQRFMAAEDCVCYRMDGHMVRAVASLPKRPHTADEPPHIPSGLIAQAVRERRVVTVRDRLLTHGPEALRGEAVLVAGPLLDRDGAVIGVVAIERLPFTKLTPTSVRLFGLVLDWGAAALQNATRYAETRAASVLDDETGAYRGEHMLRLARQESLRSGRYQLPFSIVVMQIDGYETIAAPVRAALTRTVLAIAGSGLRTVDTIGHHPTPGIFILLLPMTATETAQVVVARIDDQLWEANLRPYEDDRRLVVNYGFLTDATQPEHIEATLDRMFADDVCDTPTAVQSVVRVLRPLTLVLPDTDDDDDYRMVGD
ncbi:MAG: hypothetical protein M3Z19_09185 [Chloroflexota bacterium]|nr:hypothetical protein [Chloroflexota bacterium]